MRNQFQDLDFADKLAPLSHSQKQEQMRPIKYEVERMPNMVSSTDSKPEATKLMGLISPSAQACLDTSAKYPCVSSVLQVSSFNLTRLTSSVL
ncbi:hypothetical protein RRG08_035579 [Elysia crispata]|uniref:Uncharacterized protein n=1 Tax=Elysia crispata TaxID=231223 RepID=A0AAE1EA29_9GAST|nr:hypothetical protein RRG08_035579 [Elysia crispata]